MHDCGHVAEDSTDENSPKEVDLIKIENIAAREKETAILIPEVFNIYREKLTAIAITSDDMEPTISKNAIILCNDFGFVGSGIYAVKINGVYSVKRISLKNTESYIMACDNKLYETFEVAINDERLEIVGLVRVAINIL
ncbi:S24 family peptidase [Brachyspira aalborgi]|uniref:S24 family peptidase n=1 Tax=Brachyspira aalborgi TaxID=29522 RepID=A0AB38Q170_9SPIR|nr:S24 family peptidase [Brachyspira aalborgi]TXJ25514.1 S24 family peptidase [Brachyspira aalborgi]TXJ41739.1 S24 family peptidase [Brachyspira aalborgi]